MSKIFCIFLFVLVINPFLTSAQNIEILEQLKKETTYHLTKSRDYDSMIMLADKGLEKAIESSTKAWQAIFYKLKGKAFERQKIFDSATMHYEKAIALNKEAGVLGELAKCYLYMGVNYFRQSKHDEAIDYYHQAIVVAKANNMIRVLTSAYNNIGLIYKRSGDYTKAVEYYQKSLELAVENDVLYDQAQALGNLATCYGRISNYNLSNRYYKESLAIRKKMGDQLAIINSKINLAHNYSMMGHKDSALNMYIETLSIAEKEGTDIQKAALYSNISAIYVYRKKPQLSLEYSQKAYKINKRIMRHHGLISSCLNMVEAYGQLQQYNKAWELLDEALDIANKKNLVESKKDIFESFSDLYRNKGDFRNALKYKELMFQIKDSILNTKVATRIEEMQIQYDTEKKERRIAELVHHQKVSELNEQKRMRNFLIIILILVIIVGAILVLMRQSRLRSKARETNLGHKLLRTQMNPHFIFNSLNSINAFIGTNKGAEAQMFLTRFAKLMRNILEGSKNEYVTLEKEVETLRYYIELEQLRFNGNFDFNISVSDDIDVSFVELPPMLIQPFVENSIKHGLKASNEGGEISITFSIVNEELLYCNVTDNGVGINQTENKKSHKSYAMGITRERLAMLNKKKSKQITFEVTDRSGKGEKGTEVQIWIPLG